MKSKVPCLKYLVSTIIGLSIAASLRASAGELEQPVANDVHTRKKVTLCLGGGALKAVGAIGALRVLEEHHVPIDIIYGTSAGSAIGALYAAGMPVPEIEKLFVSGAWQRAAANHLYVKAAFVPLTKVIPLAPRNKWPGILAGTHYQQFFKNKIPDQFEDLKIPFRAVATNLCTGQPVVLKSGELSRAVLASSCAPPVLKPVPLDDMLLVDGGLRANLPVSCAREQGEGQFTIAVCSDGPIRIREKKYFSSIQRLQRRTIDLMSFQGDVENMKNADILIVPDIDDVPAMTKNSKKVKAAIDAGARATLKALPMIEAKLGAKLGDDGPLSSGFQ